MAKLKTGGIMVKKMKTHIKKEQNIEEKKKYERVHSC
jgi:hypothetical protein